MHLINYELTCIGIIEHVVKTRWHEQTRTRALPSLRTAHLRPCQHSNSSGPSCETLYWQLDLVQSHFLAASCSYARWTRMRTCVTKREQRVSNLCFLSRSELDAGAHLLLESSASNEPRSISLRVGIQLTVTSKVTVLLIDQK